MAKKYQVSELNSSNKSDKIYIPKIQINEHETYRFE